MKKFFSFAGMVCSCLLIISITGSHSFAQNGVNWVVNGNSTTNGDFLGTTNSEPLVFKTNGNVRLKIKPNGDIVVKDFDNMGIGFVKFDNNGKLIPAVFNGGINQVLTANGSFQDISLISGWKISGFDVVNTNTANIGIGTSTPSEKLSVIGNILNDGFLITRGISIIGRGQGERLSADTMQTHIMMMDTLSKIEGETRIVGNASVSEKFGIGTKYPTEALEIVGNSRINGNSSISGTVSSTVMASNDVYISGIQKQQLLTTDLSGKVTTLSPLGLQTLLYADQQKQCQPGANPVWASNNGKLYVDLINCPYVGIGTSDPQTPLEVVGEARISGKVQAGTLEVALSGSNNPMSFYPMGGTRTAHNIFTPTGLGDLILQNSTYSSQNLGIGLANGQAPSSKLHIAATQPTGFFGLSRGVVSLNSPYTNNSDYFTPIDFIYTPNGNPVAKVGAYFDAGGSRLLFGTSNNYSQGITSQGLEIDANGHLGSPYASPDYQLNVSGIVNAAAFYINGVSITSAIAGASQWTNVTGGIQYIGNTNICGNILTKEVIVDAIWCDYVFEKDYKLLEWKERAEKVKAQKHLLYMEKAETIEKEGAKVSTALTGILRNTEEHELYLNQLFETISNLENRIKQLEKANEELKSKN